MDPDKLNRIKSPSLRLYLSVLIEEPHNKEILKLILEEKRISYKQGRKRGQYESAPQRQELV